MPRTAEGTAPPRRTQAERRASTRALLLDATLTCLSERGYAGTTMAEIESRAGVSRGARLHHFPSKAGLLSSAVGHLYARMGERYHETMAQLSPERNRFREGLRLLWQTYADPANDAVLELFLAARTDPELREALRESLPDYQRGVRRSANNYFPDLAVREADGLLEALQAAMTGLALRRAVFESSRTDERVLGLLEHMVRQSFDGTAPRGEPDR